MLWLFFAALFVAVFASAWVGACALLSHLGGWSRLARVYRDKTEGNDEILASYRWKSGGVGWVSYNNCLRFDVCKRGLRIGTLGPFAVGHPTLFIEWNDFHSASKRTMPFRRLVAVKVGVPTIAKLSLPSEIWETSARGAAKPLT